LDQIERLSPRGHFTKNATNSSEESEIKEGMANDERSPYKINDSKTPFKVFSYFSNNKG
jgi:hypothetical protein